MPRIRLPRDMRCACLVPRLCAALSSGNERQKGDSLTRHGSIAMADVTELPWTALHSGERNKGTLFGCPWLALDFN